MADRIVKVILRGDISSFTSAMGAAGKSVGEVADKMSDSAKKNSKDWHAAGQTLTVVGGAITALGVAALKTGIEYNTLQQRSRAALTTILGSAEAANEQMDKLDEFARSSPFAKQVFITAQQQLLGFGMAADRVLPTLDAIQNAVAAVGGSNEDIAGIAEVLAKVEGQGKITAETLNELGIRGIDAATIIGEQMGMTGAEIRTSITQGTLDAQEALTALTDGMQEHFGGAAAGVKDTFVGALDRVKAAWRDLSSELAEPLVGKHGGGALVGLANDAADAMRWFQKLPGPVKGTAAAVTGVAGAATLAAGSFLLLAPRILATREALQKLGVTGANTTRVMKGLGAAATVFAVGSAIGAGIDAIRDKMKDALPGMEEFTRQLLNMNEAKGLGGDWTDFGESLEKANGGLGATASKIDGVMSALGPFSTAARAAGDALSGHVSDGLMATHDALAEVEAKAALVDQTFANMVNTGGPTIAAEMFEKFAAANHISAEAQQYLLDRMPQYKEALAGEANAAALAADGSGKAADGIAAVGSAASSAKVEIYSLNDAMDLLFNAALDVDSATVSWKRGLASLKDEVKDNAKTLDINTEAGRKNRDALRGNVHDLRSWAEAVYQQTGNLKGLERRLLNGREAIIKAGKAAGFSEKEMRAYLKELGLTPKEIKSDVRLIGTDKAEDQIHSVHVKLSALDKTVAEAKVTARDQASATIAAIRNSLMSLHDKTINIRAVHTESRLGPIRSADGSLLEFYAGGGVRENHVAQIAPAGAWRVWAEPETGGEAYIPLAASKRDRSLDIWRAVGDRLGVEFLEFAQGGVVSYANGGVNSRSKAKTAAERAHDREQERHRKALAAAREELNKFKSKLQETKQELASYKQEIRSSFTHDIFGNGVAGMKLQLQADRNDARAMNKALHKAAAKGLDGGLFKAVAASGDLNTAQQLAGMSKAQIRQYERLYNQRQSATRQLANYAGDRMYGAEVKRLNKTVGQLTKTVKGLEHAVERGSEKGTRRGVGDRNRNTQQRRRAGR